MIIDMAPELKSREAFAKNNILSILSTEDIQDSNPIINVLNRIERPKTIIKFNNRAIMCISNYCDHSCRNCYCNSQNNKLNRSRLEINSILDGARIISSKGITEVILKSGVDKYFDTDLISHIIYKIKKETHLDVILSLCDRGQNDYESWAIAGTDHYLISFGINDDYKFLNGINGNKHYKKIIENKKIPSRISLELIIDSPDVKIEVFANFLLSLTSQKIESIIIAPISEFRESKINYDKNTISAIGVIAVIRLLLPEVQIFTYPSILNVYLENSRKQIINDLGISGLIEKY